MQDNHLVGCILALSLSQLTLELNIVSHLSAEVASYRTQRGKKEKQILTATEQLTS